MDTPQTRFAALLDTHRGIVFKVANAYCRQPDDRQDLAQEIAAQLWRAFPGYDAARPFSTWMYRIALNVAISHARGAGERRRRTAPLDAHEDAHGDDGRGAPAHEGLSVEDHAARHEADERVRLLHAVIERQPPMDRALLLLWLEDRGQREIADVLGLSESNVATKLHRLKQRIRRQLDELDPA